MSLSMPEEGWVDRNVVLRYAREMDYATFPPIRVVKQRDDYYFLTYSPD